MPTLGFNNSQAIDWGWQVAPSAIKTDAPEIKVALMDLSKPVFVAKQSAENGTDIGVSHSSSVILDPEQGSNVLAFAQALLPQDLGCDDFKRHHGVKYAYHGGAMANGIASVEMVVACGKAGLLCSFGAAGLLPDVAEKAIKRIQEQLPNGPYAVNLIYGAKEQAIETAMVESFLKLGVKTVEASAYLTLSEAVVWYRLAGLSKNADGSVKIGHKVIAKVSRTEVASRFMSPAPHKIVNSLLKQNKITQEQADLAKFVPMADDITAEADSGGHTDNRPFLTLLPSIMALKDEIQRQYQYQTPLRVGVGGGIGTPESVLAAFNMGAAYVVVGSVNQSCIEAGACAHTRKLLSEVGMADVTMAPAADMFEMGVKLQVLSRGTLFAARANKLYDIYVKYDSIEDISEKERKNIEQRIFQASLDDIWQQTIDFFKQRDQQLISQALDNPKRKMALIFRWYLGLSSRWSNIGEPNRQADYQIWAGPSIGAFNSWVKGSYLADFENRKVVDVALHLLKGAAFSQRVNQLKLAGVTFDTSWLKYEI